MLEFHPLLSKADRGLAEVDTVDCLCHPRKVEIVSFRPAGVVPRRRVKSVVPVFPPGDHHPAVSDVIVAPVLQELRDLVPLGAVFFVFLLEYLVLFGGPRVGAEVRIQIIIPPLAALARVPRLHVERDLHPVLGAVLGDELGELGVFIGRELELHVGLAQASQEGEVEVAGDLSEATGCCLGRSKAVHSEKTGFNYSKSDLCELRNLCAVVWLFSANKKRSRERLWDTWAKSRVMGLAKMLKQCGCMEWHELEEDGELCWATDRLIRSDWPKRYFLLRLKIIH